MRNPSIGIECLSLFGLDPVSQVRLAATLGCEHVSLNLRGPANCLPPHQPVMLCDDKAARDATGKALRDEGVRLSLLEGFAILPDQDASEHLAALDMAAQLGARAICAISLDKDAERAAASFRSLAEMADERGLIVTTEVGAGTVRNLTRAIDAVRAVEHPAFGLLIDTMHYFRSGSTVEDLDLLRPDWIRHVQLCDVPMPAVIESYMEEALFERRAPGGGDLPLRAFLQSVPDGVPVGLEIPMRSEAGQGISHLDRMKRCIALTRGLF
ncbi:MAG: sugar phosphate isomerase/epimerase [Novosphingobium sp.]|nr:sugar phosphate isomerase/epimerase [Novosphingobium sp.]